MKARKKPVIVEAIQWNGNNTQEILDFCNGNCVEKARGAYLYVTTLEGGHIASVDDYIIKGVNGEFYPCKPDIFEKTYDVVNESEQYEPQKHYENLKQWVDGNLICEYDDPVWNKEAYEAIHFILDDYKNKIDLQLTVEEIESLSRYYQNIMKIISRNMLNIFELAYTVDNYDLELCINAINKLQKQKEELESEKNND